jgi:hypothetical protein
VHPEVQTAVVRCLIELPSAERSLLKKHEKANEGAQLRYSCCANRVLVMVDLYTHFVYTDFYKFK